MCIRDSNDTLRIIVVRNPGKSVPGKIVFPQRRVLPVKPVEGTDEMLQHSVGFVVQQQPVQAAFKIPFLELAEFTAHKKQLFPRMCHHIPQERPHPREFLLIAARHFVHQGSLAVHHLVVGNRQDKVFRKSVEKGKGQVVVIEFAEPGRWV